MTEPTTNGEAGDRRLVWLAAGWSIAFLLLFYSFTLPNSQPATSRADIWRMLLDHYVLWIGSPAAEPDSGLAKLSQRFDSTIVAMAIHVAAWAVGGLILRLLHRGARDLRGVERHVYASGLGLSALSLLTLGLGLAGCLYRWLFVGLLSAATIAEAVLWIRSRSSNVEQPGRSGFRLPVFCLIVVAPFVVAMLLGSLLPSVDFDVKEYHLQGPKEFFQNGRISFLPHNVYTSFPFLTEMLSLLAMVLRDDWFAGALTGKAVLMGFAPLTAVAIFVAGQRLFSTAAGWLAATIHLTTPWIYRISIIAYAEGGLTFYLFVSLLAAVRAVDEFRVNGSMRPFLLVGLFAGSAMACKYPGVLQVVIPMGIVAVATPFFHKGEGGAQWKAALRCGGVLAAGTLIAVGPWLVKNSLETRNPVYPLLYSVFGGADWDDAMNAKWRAGHSPDNHEIADLGVKFVDVTLKSDWLSPLLFCFAPLSLLSSEMRKRAGWLWLYVTFLFLAWWVFTHRIDRFWVPMIPVVSLLAGAGATWNRSTSWRRLCGTVMIVAVVYNLGYITSRFSGYNAYLKDIHAAREAVTPPVIRYLNRELPKNAKVLCVGEAEVFDARFPLVYNTVFDRSIFEEWFGKSAEGVNSADKTLRSATDIRATLAKHKITHVFVNWAEIERYRQTYGYTEFVTRERFQALQAMGVLGESLLGDVDPKTGQPLPYQVFEVIR